MIVLEDAALIYAGGVIAVIVLTIWLGTRRLS